MPVLSATTKEAQYVHVMDNILQRHHNTSPLAMALELYFGQGHSTHKDIDNIISLTEGDIDILVYEVDVPDPNSPTNAPIKKKTAIPRGDKALLLTLINFGHWKRNKGEEVKPDKWTDVDYDEFRDYRVNHHWATLNRRVPTTNPPTSGTGSGGSSGSSYTPKTPSEAFRYGIKKDTTQYPMLKQDNGFDDWYRLTLSLAHTHDIYDVFNENYVPVTTEEIELFKLKQQFVYSILVRCLMTDKGKSLVRDYEKDHDAQKVIKELVEHHRKSTKSDLESTDRLEYIMTATISGPSSTWKGNARGFIHHWLEQVRKYEDATAQKDHFNEGQKQLLLQKAVKPIDKLDSVTAMNRAMKAAGQSTGDYEAYLKLLFSTADEYDKDNTRKHGTGSARKRNVYTHDLDIYSDNTPEGPSEYDIDTPLDMVFGHDGGDIHDQWQAFQAQRGFRPRRNTTDGSGKPRFVLPSSSYSKLSFDAKKLWQQIPREFQELIVQAGKTSGDTTQSVNKLMQLVNVHYGNIAEGAADDDPPQEAHSLLEYMVNKSDQAPDSAPETPPPSDEIIHPAALINMMAKRKNPPGNTTNTRSANMHDVVYTVHTRNRSIRTIASLIDRGANGGVGGEDLRVIDWDDSGRTVDIEGVDDHRVRAIKLATLGGYTETNQGPVIAIFHQYAYLGKGPSIHSSGQIEAYGHNVCDKSAKVGGKQRMTVASGNHTYIFPFSIQRGLVRMNMRPYSDHEFATLPHIVMTSDTTWDPSILDGEIEPSDYADDGTIPASKHYRIPFTPLGEYSDRYEAQSAAIDAGLDTDSLYGSDGSLSLPDRAPDDDIDKCIEDCVIASMDHQEKTRTTWVANLARLTHGVMTTIVTLSAFFIVAFRNSTVNAPDYNKLRPMFAWMSPETIEQTFDRTTQYARVPGSTILHRTYKTPYPALNVPRRDEDVSSDTVYGPVPAIDNGSTMAQIFVGHSSLLTDVYGMKTEKQFVNTLEDNIRERGAMRRLLTDSARVETSNKAYDLLRALMIGAWQSEPGQQNQNPCERRINTLKTRTNIVMDRTAAPPYTWLLALEYVCDLLNCVYHESIGGVPLQIATGQTVDISAFLRFFFHQSVYYRAANPKLGETAERRGRWVGISRHVGHGLCYKILDDTTLKIHHCSSVRPVDDSDLNLRLEPIGGEHDPIIKSLRAKHDEETNRPLSHKAKAYEYKHATTVPEQITIMEKHLANLDVQETTPQPPAIMTPVLGENGERTEPSNFHPDDLIGRTFLVDDNDTRNRLRIVESLEDMESDLAENPTRIKYRVQSGDDSFEDIMTYAEVLDHIEKQEQQEQVLWKYKSIVSHQGPLRPDDPHYMGSMYNVKMEWEDGSTTYEPLNIIAADDPVTCAIYAKENNLLERPGWKRFKRLASRTKKFIRAVNQAKLRSYNTAPKYKYGYEVPKNYADAVRLDERNKTTKWQDAVALEMTQLDDYKTFKTYGRVKPSGYKKIKVHLVFDVKHDGRHKARMVADGHLTDIPLESVYSGVVSIRGIRIVAFLSALNDLDLWQTDIGNAYLEAKTSERNCVLAGPEFGPEREGMFLIIVKALYGLRTSGKMWHIRFSECLREMGFEPCKAEPDVWLRRTKNRHGIDVYEYVAVYVDDLMMALVDPEAFVRILQVEYKFKLKGTDKVSFHLGIAFFQGRPTKKDKDGNDVPNDGDTRDPEERAYEDSIWALSAVRYIDRMLAEYKRHFGTGPKQYNSPLEHGDHPELDDSEFLEGDRITLFQSLMGSLQWAVTIGRFDILTAVVSMSSFRAAPRKGHLLRLQRMYGYLAKFQDAAIRIRTEEPDFSALPESPHTWDKSVYGTPSEELPKDAPTPLGKHVQLTHYVDANLMHNVLTGKSLTGILHFANQTPIDWYSKKQSTVETATFGSEIVAARTATEQIIDLRNTFRYLGVPIRETSYLFGDNKTVVDSTMTPHSKLNKRHTMLSYHRVRHAIATGFLVFQYIPGALNPADILSKHWSYSTVYDNLIKPLMHWRGDVGKMA